MKRSSLLVAMPLLLLGAQSTKGAILTADVAVHSPAGQYIPLEVGTLWNNWFQYYWYDVPAFAKDEDFLVWDAQLTGYPNPEDGVTTFEVLTDGPVLMAVTDEKRWGWGYNDEPITTRAQLEAQGWVEFARGLIVAHTGTAYTYPEGSWEYIVFRRDSVAGEAFTYRTERYCPPVIIRSETVIPEPSTFVTWSLLGALGIGLLRWRGRRTT